MKFETAAQYLSENNIKLPEWVGHWFLDPSVNFKELKTLEDIKKHIKVYSRTGEVLDTPHFDKYEQREDWIIIPKN